ARPTISDRSVTTTYAPTGARPRTRPTSQAARLRGPGEIRHGSARYSAVPDLLEQQEDRGGLREDLLGQERAHAPLRQRRLCRTFEGRARFRSRLLVHRADPRHLG